MKRKILLGIGISTILLLTAFAGVSASDALQRENTARKTYDNALPSSLNDCLFNVNMDSTEKKIGPSAQKKLTKNTEMVIKEMSKYSAIKGNVNVAARLTISVAKKVSRDTDNPAPGGNCFILLVAFYGALGMALTHPGSSYFWTMVAWEIADMAKTVGCWWAFGQQEGAAEDRGDSTAPNMDIIVGSKCGCETP